jgi:MFS family permease
MFTLVVPIQTRLPDLLHANRDDTAWVVTATLLAAAVITPIAGRLGDMYGKRRIVLVLLATLVVGSVIAAVSTGLIWLIVGRALQGAVTGVIPLGISILRTCSTKTASIPPSPSSVRLSASEARSGCRSARW